MSVTEHKYHDYGLKMDRKDIGDKASFNPKDTCFILWNCSSFNSLPSLLVLCHVAFLQLHVRH